MASLAEFVRNRREELGLTQTDIEQRAGVPQAYLSDVERGRTVRPSPEFRSRLATALGVSPVDLLLAAGEVSREDLEAWARREGFRRDDRGSWAERLAAELGQEEDGSPRALLARAVPLLLLREAAFLLRAIDHLEGWRTREALRRRPAEYRRWRDTEDVLEVQ